MKEKQVTKDLRDIQYYYARQREIDTSSKSIGFDKFYDLVEKYNKAVDDLANPKYYEIYTLVYVQGLDCVQASEEIGYSYLYFQKLVKKFKIALTEYFGFDKKGC